MVVVVQELVTRIVGATVLVFGGETLFLISVYVGTPFTKMRESMVTCIASTVGIPFYSAVLYEL